MAIDYKGQITTTGMMNQSPGANTQVPNMTNLAPPKKPTQPVRQPVRQPVETAERTSPLTDEDMTVLAPVLSPSVKSVLAKIIPEISPLIEEIGPDEETVPVKVSTFISLPEDIQNFIIESSIQQMDTNNVPLDTSPDTSGMMARQEPEIPQTSEGDMDYSQIDEGLIS
jgi:hypothetical protein